MIREKRVFDMMNGNTVGKKLAAVALALSFLSIQMACGGFGSRGGSARQAPQFKPGFNLFSLDQDIELGRQSAQQIAREVPLLNDEATVNYIRQLGAKLAAQAPGHKFPYQFNVVATKDINAFALPGGYIFVNAGVIMTAKNEGELAGVMAHEIMHVALRHGTNQASKAYIARAGLGILGSIAGDSPEMGQIINVIGGVGANALFLKFGRTAETQADLGGARIMAEAGYDPRDMASFFKNLEAQGKQRVPEFLSDHPDPGNRIAAINDVLPSLQVSPNPTRTTPEFDQVKARLTRDVTRLAQSDEPARVGPRDPQQVPHARVEPPSGTLRPFQSRNNSFALEYPQNWDALTADDVNLIFAPRGAYGRLKDTDSVVVTHGLFAGTADAPASDLQSATVAFVQKQIEGNPDFQVVRNPEAVTIGGRQGMATVVAGPSTVTGVVEIDVIYTVITEDGRLFYLITIAPEDELNTYRPAFEQIIRSVRL